MTFDRTLDMAIHAFSMWSLKQKCMAVTIIRDVNGRLSFLLEMTETISEPDCRAFKNLLSGELGNFFQGNLYVKQNTNNDLIKMVIEEIERLRWRYTEQVGVQWYLLERAIAKKAWVELDREEEAIWSFEKAQSGEMPKVVTFYSFKGGMGRTTSLAAVALNLVRQGKNVLAIDTDIEAPGLASLFSGDEEGKRGTVDFMIEAAVVPENIKIDMSDMLFQVNDPVLMENADGKLFVIPAGVVDENYLQKLARIDFQDTIPGNMKKQISRLIREAVDTIRQVCGVDYVLLDSRAGFHDMGGVVTAQMPHGALLFGKDSRQSWQGLELVLKSISHAQKERPFVAIVDSTCGVAGVITAEERSSFTGQAYMACCESFYSEEEEQPGPEALEEAHSPIFMPYAAALSGDIRLYTDGSESRGNELRQIKQLLLGECYQNMCGRIQRWFDRDEND